MGFRQQRCFAEIELRRHRRALAIREAEIAAEEELRAAVTPWDQMLRQAWES